jgi:hypothetical protein
MRHNQGAREARGLYRQASGQEPQGFVSVLLRR